MAGDENVPVHRPDWRRIIAEKKAYQVLRKLIREQWHTDAQVDVPRGYCCLQGLLRPLSTSRFVMDSVRSIRRFIFSAGAFSAYSELIWTTEFPNDKRNPGRSTPLNCTPFVRQYDILSNKWGVLLCQKEYQTNDIRRSSREWL